MNRIEFTALHEIPESFLALLGIAQWKREQVDFHGLVAWKYSFDVWAESDADEILQYTFIARCDDFKVTPHPTKTNGRFVA